MYSFVSGFSLSILALQITPAAVQVSCLLPLTAGPSAFEQVGQSLFTHSFVGVLGCFQFRAIMNKSAKENLVKYLLFTITKAKMS